MWSLLAVALVAATVPTAPAYSGEDGELEVAIPRIEDPEVDIDARLEEAVWNRAARLDGFTQYEPVEGAPVTEETEVLVFYCATI